MNAYPWQEAWVEQHSALLCESFYHWTGQPLLPEMGELTSFGAALFHSPRVVLSHDTQADPQFNYANQRALDLWETTWDQLIGLPSRLSAEPEVQPERQHFLHQVHQQGWAKDYQGIRITRQGRKFLIRNAILWNVVDAMGNLHGQAATFTQWDWLDAPATRL
jgi:hypothetical protein